MSIHLTPAQAINSLGVELDLEPLPEEQIISGDPQTGFLELGTFSGVDIGIWQHSEGTSTDTESDEVFIVLSGSATIDFLNSDYESLDVSAGSIVQLSEGMKTRWTIHETLRKVYLTPAEG